MLNLVPISPKALFCLAGSIVEIVGAQQGIGQILLGQPMMGSVVGILIKLALALHLRGIVVLVLQAAGNRPRLSRPNIGKSGIQSLVCGIGLGRLSH